MNTVVYDRTWHERGLPPELNRVVETASHPLPVSPTCTLTSVNELAARLPSDGRVTVIGGGGVIDTAKLAAVARQIPLTRHVSHGRAGIATIPTPSPSRLRVYPTTLGTGSEANAKAVLEVTPGRRRLIVGTGLRPKTYTHVPHVYATLPKRLVIHGILEIFFRAVALLSVPEIDSEGEVDGFVSRAARLAVAAAQDPSPGADRDLMARVARLSVQTHTFRVPGERLRWAWPLWYLANELSTLAGVTKIEATLVLFPHVLRGTDQFQAPTAGVAHHLHQVLGLPPQTFVERVCVPPSPSALRRIRSVDLERLTRQTFSHWAGPTLPLAGMSALTLYEIYESVMSREP